MTHCETQHTQEFTYDALLDGYFCIAALLHIVFSACVQSCNTAEVDHMWNMECIELECLIEGGQSPWWGDSPLPPSLKLFDDSDTKEAK